MNLGNKLKKLREENGFSLQQLADKIDISKTVIWQYEANKSMPSAEVIKKFAVFYNVSTDSLLFDNSERPEMTKHYNKEIAEKIYQVYKLDIEDYKFIEKCINLILDKNRSK